MSALVGAWIAIVALVLIVAQHFYLRSRLREQRRIEAELRASEQKFAGILGIAADAIITVDQTQRIVHFNRGAEQTFGYKSRDIIGQDLSILIPARFRGSHDSHVEQFALTTAPSRRMGDRREIFGVRADGTEFAAEASISKLATTGGLLYTAVLRDITDQRRSEANERFLAAASAELAQTLAVEATVHAIVDLPVPRLAGACLLDLAVPGGLFRRLSSTRQRSELTSPLKALEAMPLTYDSPSPVIDVVRRNRRELVEVVDEEWLDTNAEREAIPYWRALGARALLILPLHAGGETLGALTLVSSREHGFDADRRVLAEKYAANAATALANARLYDGVRRANRARDEVLGLVSHDLRNPINAIAMCARVLRDSPPADPARRNELLTTITESTEWLNRLIQDLVDVAHIERGRLSLEVEMQDPSQLVQQALHMFQVEADENGIQIEARVSPDLPQIAADGARVVQVLGNLLRNAVTHTPRGGRVVIAAAPCDGGVEFTVCDTGAGISQEDQAHVFERYWRAGGSGGRQRGSGLGLSIARGIVEAHGGHIRVTSEVGAGSTFAFVLPQFCSSL